MTDVNWKHLFADGMAIRDARWCIEFYRETMVSIRFEFLLRCLDINFDSFLDVDNVDSLHVTT